jgi:hypothetical protein
MVPLQGLAWYSYLTIQAPTPYSTRFELEN